MRIMLVCDDEPGILRTYQRTLQKIIADGIIPLKLTSEQGVETAVPHEKMAVFAENSDLILAFAKKFSSAQTIFGLITDGEFAANDKLATGHNLIVELRKICPDLQATMITGNPGRFKDLTREHDYSVVGNPPEMKDIIDLFNDFFNQ